MDMLFRILLLSFSLPNSLAAEEDPVASSRTVFLSRYVLRICLNYLFYSLILRLTDFSSVGRGT